jgi:hypothetical protein
MAGAQFNPPPNWPVPPRWSPPPNWDPPLSWPPAPPGWIFWLSEPVAGPQNSAAPVSTLEDDTLEGDAQSPPPRPWWRPPASVIVYPVALAVLAAIGLGFVFVDHPSTRIRLLPDNQSIAPTSGPQTGTENVPTWRDPGWVTPLYIDFAGWTKFGGIDAAFSDSGESVVLDTHDTTDTWHTKWSGLISPKTTACAMRIAGRVRDISHTSGVPGGFGIGVGTLGPGNTDGAELAGSAIQFDFGQQGYRTAIYPSDSDHGLVSAALDHQWHQIDVVINADSHTLAVDGHTAATTPAGGQCGRPVIRVWAGSAEFDQFTVTPLA